LVSLSLTIFAIPYIAINTWLISNKFWSWGWEFVLLVLTCDIIIFLPLREYTWGYYKRRVRNSGHYIARKRTLDEYGLNEKDIKGPNPEYKFKYPDDWKKGYEHFGSPDK
jgi:hypothetical protein